MAPPIPTVVPSEIRAGDTVQFSRAYGDFPASDGWQLKCTISGPGHVTTTASEGVFTFGAADTAELAPGTYRYVITATSSGARHTAEDGVLTVHADVESATAGALQSSDEKLLALLDAELEARAASDHTEYSIDGRSLKREPLETLIAWRNSLRRTIARRRRGGALAMVAVTFPARGVLQ